MSGTGPVEPADPTRATAADDPTGTNSPRAEPDHDIIGTDSPRLSDRWHALPPRVRHGALAAGAVAAATAAVLLIPQPPAAAPPDQPPPPRPSAVTDVRYLGIAGTPATEPTGDFLFEVTVRHGPPVTVDTISTTLTGLRTLTTPDTPFTVRSGTTQRLTVHISVSRCSGLPLDPELPILDVTLRNTDAIQQHSFIFGDPYSRDLSALLHSTCDDI
ncbi:hypothetical protein [Streptomyces sp. NPDC058371]|uniref:hypothetical protein n=1 Tax=Streptomyces sp. NPDC058371 TaxID=3346463 RepID=UPI00364B1731